MWVRRVGVGLGPRRWPPHLATATRCVRAQVEKLCVGGVLPPSLGTGQGLHSGRGDRGRRGEWAHARDETKLHVHPLNRQWPCNV